MYVCAYVHMHICTYVHIMYIVTYVHIGVVQVGRKIHSRLHVDFLRFGAANRRGRYLPERGRCVSCYASAPLSDKGSITIKVEGVAQVCYACDVCRVLLCRDCFHNVYDHSTRGVPVEYVTLR